MNKEKIIRLIYLLIFILPIFFYFIYPNPGDSKMNDYLYELFYCKVETTKDGQVIIDKLRPTVCAGDKAWFNLDARNYYWFRTIISLILSIILILIVWRTRKNVVSLGKNILNKI